MRDIDGYVFVAKISGGSCQGIYGIGDRYMKSMSLAGNGIMPFDNLDDAKSAGVYFGDARKAGVDFVDVAKFSMNLAEDPKEYDDFLDESNFVVARFCENKGPSYVFLGPVVEGRPQIWRPSCAEIEYNGNVFFDNYDPVRSLVDKFSERNPFRPGFTS